MYGTSVAQQHMSWLLCWKYYTNNEPVYIAYSQSIIQMLFRHAVSPLEAAVLTCQLLLLLVHWRCFSDKLIIRLGPHKLFRSEPPKFRKYQVKKNNMLCIWFLFYFQKRILQKHSLPLSFGNCIRCLLCVCSNFILLV